jgi:LPS-assembly protein
LPLEVQEATIHLTADRLEQMAEVYEAEGSVIITQGPLRLSTDRLRFDAQSGDLEARGRLQLTEGANHLSAERADLNLHTQRGLLTDGRLFLAREHYFLEGERIERLAPDRYLLETASFTPCDCDPDWQIRARQLRLDTDRLVARGMRFYVGGLPILYLPYFTYPTESRTTGFLIPRLGYRSQDGFRYQQDFFLTMGPSRDASFSWNDRGATGRGGGIEYRYRLSERDGGGLEADYFRDNAQQSDRFDLRYQHTQRLGEQTRLMLDLRSLHPRDNLRILGDDVAQRSRTSILSDAVLNYHGERVAAYLLAQYAADLNDPDQDLARLPEIGLLLPSRPLGPLWARFDGRITRFFRPSEAGVRGTRIDLHPHFSKPIVWGGVWTPWVAFRAVGYYAQTDESSLIRNIVPAGLHWETRLTRRGAHSLHEVTPMLRYGYIAAEEADVPQYDDLDRVADRNALTAVLEQRWSAGDFMELGWLRVSRTYLLRGPDKGPSDLRAEMHISPLPGFWLEMDSFFGAHRMALWNADLRLNVRSDLELSLGHRYAREGIISKRGDIFDPRYLGDSSQTPRVSHLTYQVVFNVGWGVRISNRAYLDMDQGTFSERAYALQYDRDCWGVTWTYTDLPDHNLFSFSVRLKGLGERTAALL